MLDTPSQPPSQPTPQPLPSSIANVRSGQLHLDTFSPINQNGAFEFDRVIKSGEVSKRTRKTKVTCSAQLDMNKIIKKI